MKDPLIEQVMKEMEFMFSKRNIVKADLVGGENILETALARMKDKCEQDCISKRYDWKERLESKIAQLEAEAEARFNEIKQLANKNEELEAELKEERQKQECCICGKYTECNEVNIGAGVHFRCCSRECLKKLFEELKQKEAGK